MAWWQKKLLRYALARTGLLDDGALNLDNLDITLGRKNVVELKDVGLNIGRLSKLAQLPPSIRIEAARVLSLRLTIPADIYQSSIVAEIDGVHLNSRLEEERQSAPSKSNRDSARSPSTTRTAPHRKVRGRLHSPPPFDPGGGLEEDGAPIPTTEQLAKSFLLDESLKERRELEASIAAANRALDESVVSETSDNSDAGTGASIGLPGFLAGFLQGIVDRLQFSIKNVEVQLEVQVPSDEEDDHGIYAGLQLRIGDINLSSLSSKGENHVTTEPQNGLSKRRVELRNMSINLFSNATVFAELSDLSSRSSPLQSRSQGRSPEGISEADIIDHRSGYIDRATSADGGGSRYLDLEQSQSGMHNAIPTPFADATSSATAAEALRQKSDLEIQPGDDNISWGTRRNNSFAPAEDLWGSITCEDDLPDSLLMEPTLPRPKHPSSENLRIQESSASDVFFRGNLPSPGSWPLVEASPQRHRVERTPGSWPTLGHSERILMGPSLAGVTHDAEYHPLDNKIAALAAKSTSPQGHRTPPEAEIADTRSLAASRIFSHEEAESMYMSAMSNSTKMHVPGGWNLQSDISPPLEGQHNPNHFSPLSTTTDSVESSMAGDVHRWIAGDATPKAGSPRTHSGLAIRRDLIASRVTRQLLKIDHIVVWLPSENGTSLSMVAPTTTPTLDATSRPLEDLPGAFSAYSNLAASRWESSSSTGPTSSIHAPTQKSSAENPRLASSANVEVGTISSQVDVPCCRLLHRMVSKVMVANKTWQPTAAVEHASDEPRRDLAFAVSIQDVSAALKAKVTEPLNENLCTDGLSDRLLLLHCEDVSWQAQANEAKLTIGSFRTFIGSSCFVSFDRKSNLKSSVVVSEQTPDISIATRTRKSVTQFPVTDVSVETLSLNLALDVRTIDDALGPLGGLSTILEAGSSVVPDSTATGALYSTAKPLKGVHFEGDPQYIAAGAEIKLNARTAGLCATLQGSGCSVRVRSTALKLIHRQQGAVISVDHLALSGPYLTEGNGELTLIDVSTFRLEFLTSPQDKDLERLLSLLTPSKDKYDDDDDILLDTLLRQRRQGGLVRISLADVKLKCHDLNGLSSLSDLVDELGKLSAVAKYLPDDDRPGLLTLLRIKDFEARLPINERFQRLHLSLTDFHCAHVGLPALLALSAGDFSASQNGRVVLVHPLMPLQGSESLPMLMARMLGDEIEPTIKVKLFNLCVEYSVPVLLDISNLDAEGNADDIVANLVESIANLTTPFGEAIALDSGTTSNTSSPVGKNLKVDLLLHDCAISLKPKGLLAKAVLILTDAQLSTQLPPGNDLSANLELRKSGLFVADEVIPDETNAPTQVRSSPINAATKSKVTTALSKRGFVSVASVLAASVELQVKSIKTSQPVTIDVEFRNELLLLETCADSTQTLIAVLTSLAPPTPSSKQAKYLNEPMTIEDMMASFVGKEVVETDQSPQTLFDAEQGSDSSNECMTNVPMIIEDEDALLAESELTSSLYGPISGILESRGDADEDEDDAYADTAESLLEDDPFEMPDSSTQAEMTDAQLMRELNKQCRPALGHKPVDLDLYEVEDLGFDALSSNEQPLGRQNRFSTSGIRGRTLSSTVPREAIPIRLKLRDAHIIWNIYDGYDWPSTRDRIIEAVEQVEIKAEERQARRRQPLGARSNDEPVIGDFLFNSIYIGVPSNQDAQELRRQINRNIDELASETESAPVSAMSRPTTYSASGRPIEQRRRRRLKLERSKAHKVAFELKGISADFLLFPPDSGDVVSSIDVRVKDFEIFDNVPTSTWRKFLTQLSVDSEGREMSKPMVHIELHNVRTLENYSASEIVMHVTVLPLRLHVDQDALDFITRFFEFKDQHTSEPNTAHDQPFIQRIEVDNVDLCLDYKPKKIDFVGLRSGHTSEFMNFVILDGANIRLRHAIIYGLRGFEPLHKTLNDIWMPDVKRNQLPTVLAGLAPVRSLVNIGAGVRDVVAIPVREYRKDGRIVRSIQKGALTFGKTTASELARLGAKVAIGTQNLLQGAEGVLTPTHASRGSGSPRGKHVPGQDWDVLDSEDEHHERRAISAYADQPLGVFSGLRSARRYLEHDLLTARDALIAVQGEILEGSGPGSAAAAVARHAPTVILRPIIGTSRAVGTALLGVGNQIDRGNLHRVDDVSTLALEAEVPLTLTMQCRNIRNHDDPFQHPRLYER